MHYMQLILNSVCSLRDIKHVILKIFKGEKEKKDRILFSLIYCI